MMTSSSEASARSALSMSRVCSSWRRFSRAWGSLAVLSLGALPTGAALAEGAVRLLECSIVRTCDGGGHCEAAKGEVSFTMEPVDLEAAGGARYWLSYGDARAEMRALSDAGPFVWTLDSERHALLASSETQWLWHRLALVPAPEATILFLECAFRQ